jgi:hypothetical protein
MKVLFRCVFSVFLWGLVGNLYAQLAPSAIKGKVLTETLSPAENATIVLLKARDSSIVNSSVADKDGLFQFTGVQAGGYLLLVTKLGYKKLYRGPYHINGKQSITAPDITLIQIANQLKDVSIVATRPEIEFKPGKTTINVQSSITAAGNSAYDILAQSPGVRVDNSTISVTGRQNALITINGRPSNLSGDDLVSLLKGMDGSTIDYIELISATSAKNDASGAGIVNIVLKKGKNMGFNATVTANAGIGRYGKAGASINFNYREKKFNIFGNYNHLYNNTFHNLMVNRLVNDNNISTGFHVNYKTVQKINTDNFGIGADYLISPNQTIGFFVTGAFTGSNIVKNNNLQISNQGLLDSTIVANSNLNRHLSNINYNLNYTLKLDNSGKTLSADFNYNPANRTSTEYIDNNFYNADGSVYRDMLSLQNLSPSEFKIWVWNVDFTDPLSKTAKLEAGIKYSNVNSNNDLIFGPKVNNVYQTDPSFTNHFLYTENVNAAYVNFQKKLNKLDLMAGLRAEQTMSTGNSVTSNQVVNQNYTGLFPSLLLTYSYNDKTDFSFFYNRRIDRPKYQNVNPFLSYVDLYDYDQGNPYLKPVYANIVEFTYSHNKAFQATLYAHILSNADEFRFFKQNDSTKVNVNIQTNLGTVYNYGMKFDAPVSFANWWSATFSLDVAYQRYIAYPVNGTLNKGTADINFFSTQRFVISKTITADLVGHVESPTFYGIAEYKTFGWINGGISKQLFNTRGSLRLGVTDIFNTRRDKYTINYQNINLTAIDKKETQVATLTFSYRFGKTTVRGTAHKTGNEEEQKRIGAESQ